MYSSISHAPASVAISLSLSNHLSPRQCQDFGSCSYLPSSGPMGNSADQSGESSLAFSNWLRFLMVAPWRSGSSAIMPDRDSAPPPILAEIQAHSSSLQQDIL
jgi:hypothetical protein